MIDMSTTNVLPPTAVARNARELLSDGVHLAELQVQLVGADWRKAQRRLIAIVASAVAALLLVLALLPIALACAALAISELGGLSLAASFTIVLGGGLLLVAGCGLTVWLLVRKPDAFFQESRRELRRNIQWFKQTIRGRS
jgi:hypothetical protein